MGQSGNAQRRHIREGALWKSLNNAAQRICRACLVIADLNVECRQ